MSSRDRARRLYELLLGLYPRSFRERYGADLLQVFDDRRDEPRFRGTWGGLRLVLFMLRDFAVSLPLARSTGVRNDHRWAMMGDLGRDLRYSVRMLVKSPVFTATAVITLALGIGLNTATYSVVRAVLLQPLSGVEAPEELVQIYRHWPGLVYGSNSIPHYQDLRDRSGEVFERVAAHQFATMSLSADGRNERIMGMLVSANFFETFGVEAAMGRTFVPGEEDVGFGSHPVAVVGHGFWQDRFGGDPDIVGRALQINGRPFEVVGVTPEDFKGPETYAAVPVYVPLTMQAVIEPERDVTLARGSNSMSVTGRLREGVTMERAGQVLERILIALRSEFPDHYDDQLGHTLVRRSEAGMHPQFASAQVGMSAVIMAVVGLLLLIACVNVANLFLARARERRTEIGIRLSLGARRGRVVRQLLTESLVFSLVSGLAGVGLALVAVQSMGAFRPPVDGPWVIDITMDGPVLAFTFAVSVLTGLVFGLAPALQSARADTVHALKGASSQRAGRTRLTGALVVAQVGMSLLLLISSGLFLRSLQSATEIDVGIEDPSRIAMAAMDPGLQGYTPEEVRALWDRMLERVEALPQVSVAGLTHSVPLSLGGSDRSVQVPGYEFTEGERRSLSYAVVSEGYIEAIGVRLIEGRAFRPEDERGAPVMIVNRRFRDRFWPGESALGKTVATAGEEHEVIGVIETGKYRSLGEDPTEYMLFPRRTFYRSGFTLVARARGDAAPLLSELRRVVGEVDPELPVFDVRTMETHMGISLLPARLGGSVLGVFGALGLVLSAVGIYGVMAYSVVQKRRELGIRMALGAQRERVTAMMLRQGLRLAGLGMVLGLGVAVVVGRAVEGLLYDVSPLDPVAFTVVPAVLLAVAALAVYVPARRAASVDPVRTLRTE